MPEMRINRIPPAELSVVQMNPVHVFFYGAFCDYLINHNGMLSAHAIGSTNHLVEAGLGLACGLELGLGLGLGLGFG